jgi:hypothetical protein
LIEQLSSNPGGFHRDCDGADGAGGDVDLHGGGGDAYDDSGEEPHNRWGADEGSDEGSDDGLVSAVDVFSRKRAAKEERREPNAKDSQSASSRQREYERDRQHHQARFTSQRSRATAKAKVASEARAEARASARLAKRLQVAMRGGSTAPKEGRQAEGDRHLI